MYLQGKTDTIKCLPERRLSGFIANTGFPAGIVIRKKTKIISKSFVRVNEYNIGKDYKTYYKRGDI